MAKQQPQPEEKELNKLAQPESTTIPTPAPDPWNTVRVAGEIEDLDRLKCLLYGPNGSGKSTAAARFNCPLIGLTEKQAIPAIKEANPKAIIKVISTPQHLLEFRQLCRSAQLAQRCDAVVLDSLTDVQRLLRDMYTSQQEKNKDTTDMNSWGRTIDATARMAREMRDLPVHTIVICLDAEIEVEGEGLVHRPSVNGKALPNQLGQYFNLVGFISRQARPGGHRREVMFEGSDRFQTKSMTGIDAVEPPEPLLWIHKRFKKEAVDAETQKRVDRWSSVGKATSDDDVGTKTKEAASPSTTNTVDPFAGN